jgi:hypothetical protein
MIETEVKPVKVTYTLKDLRELKVSYQRQGDAYFDELCLVTRTMGCPVKIDRFEFIVFQYSEITAMYRESSEYWITQPGGMGRPAIKRVLSIFVNGNWEDPNALHVCYLERGDGAYAKYEPRFVPGKWTDILLGFMAGSLETGRAAEHRRNEAERAELMQELLIGVEI